MFHPQKIIRFMAASFVFVLMVATVFFGMQWFSASLAGMLIHDRVFTPASLEASVDSAQAIAVEKLSPVPKNPEPQLDLQVPNLSIGAQAALSIQMRNGQPQVLFAKNEQKKLPVASLTKLMTALVVLENYNLNQKITVSKTTMDQEGVQGVLKVGQEFSAESLLYSMLMESSNRAAYALSEFMGTDTFIGLMNYNARQLGLSNTHFKDTTGLDPASYSTAQDLATLSRYLFVNYPLFGQIIGLKEYDLRTADGIFHHRAVNTNESLGQNNIIGGKTGFTTEAQGCFMAIKTSPVPGNYIISVVLGSKDRFKDMRSMIDWVSNAYK